MSFEPQILINKDTLDKVSRKIESYVLQNEYKTSSRNDTLKFRAYKEISKYLEMKSEPFKNFNFILVSPELTSHNAEVRKILDSLNVEYIIFN